MIINIDYRVEGEWIMLSDFLTLEVYFGQAGAALFFDDLARHFSEKDIKRAVRNGDLEPRTVHIGPDAGRIFYTLSSSARAKLCEK